MKFRNGLLTLLIAPIAACNLAPRDTTSEQEAMIREHDRAASEKRASEQASGMPPDEVALLQRSNDEAQKETAKRAAFAEVVHHQSEQKRKIETWRGQASAECALRINFLHCSEAPLLATQDDRSKCEDACEIAVGEALQKVYSEAVTACAVAEGKATCELEFPKSAARRDGTPITSDSKIVALCSKECALKRSEIATDAVERPKAYAAGEALVLSYKRCMLAVDSTHQAVTYRIHDAGLYQDLMAKTDARCRVPSRCDWLEKYSDDWRCSYGN